MSHILLARPHPFIVSEMAPFLQEQGFSFSRLSQLDALDAELAGASAAVISLALSSPLPQTPEELLTAIWQRQPSMPIVFASLLPLARVHKNVLHLMQQHHPAAAIAAAGEMVGAAEPGQAATALYFCKDDLANSAKRDLFAKLLKLHAKG